MSPQAPGALKSAEAPPPKAVVAEAPSDADG